MLIDENTFEETNVHTEFYDPIKFPGYREKHEDIVKKLGYLRMQNYKKCQLLSLLLPVELECRKGFFH